MSGGSRPRGYMHDWKPQPHVALLLGQVREVIAQYREYGAMTVRQVFYRLVGQYDYPKDERAYARLCETLVKARRAQIVDFGSIRDEPEEAHLTGGYDSVAAWWSSELYHAKAYRRDPHEGQDVHVELWCEAAGMAPMLAQMVREFGVDVYSTGGFSSVTVTHSTAQRIIERADLEGRPTVFLHVGDFDPSGESIFNAMNEDITAFIEDDTGDVESYFRALRVALTEEQVRRYRLPTAPPKRSDTRSNNWIGQTCQLEAMDPATLDSVVTGAVEKIIDVDQLATIRAAEKVERTQLVQEVTEKIRDRAKGDE
jgi:hypothetical protein